MPSLLLDDVPCLQKATKNLYVIGTKLPIYIPSDSFFFNKRNEKCSLSNLIHYTMIDWFMVVRAVYQVVGRSKDGSAVTTDDLGVSGALCVLMKVLWCISGRADFTPYCFASLVEISLHLIIEIQFLISTPKVSTFSSFYSDNTHMWRRR